jgi:hypothetical protein
MRLKYVLDRISLGHGWLEERLPVVIRVMRGRVEPGRADELHARMRTLVESARSNPACNFIQLGRQVFEDRTEEVVLVTVWDSIAAIYEWIGCGDLLAHGIPDGGDPLFSQVDVQHFETLDLQPPDPSGLASSLVGVMG